MKTSRRDFLKFMGALAATVVAAPVVNAMEQAPTGYMLSPRDIQTQWQKWIYEAYDALNPTYPDWPTQGDKGVRFTAPLDISDLRVIRVSLDVRLSELSGVPHDKQRMHVGMEILNQELEDRGIANEVRFKELITEKLQDMVGYFTRGVDDNIIVSNA